MEQRVPRACDRGGPPQTPFDDTAEFTIIAPDRTLLENLIPGGRKSVATTASSRVWTRRNRYPTTNSNRSAPWTLERLNGCRRVDANPTTRRQTCPASGFCRFDSTKILFTGYGDVPRLVASLLQADTLETRPAGLSRDHGQPFTGGGDPLDRAVRQHFGRVEQLSVANGRAGLNRQGGDIEIFTRPGVPGPMSRQTR